MTLEEVIKILNARVIIRSTGLDTDIKMGCGSDLMSDVLAFIKSSSLLLTGLTNPQVIRTAEMADIRVICFVRGKEPPEETVKLGKDKNITLLMTHIPMFESCGLLYKSGLQGCSEYTA